MLPQMVPYPTRFPAPKAHVDRMPVAQLCRQISPRTPSAVEMQQRLQELTIAHLPGRSGKGMFRCVDRRLQLSPPMEPWTFGLQWADTRQYRSELSGGMFSPTPDADENVIRALRAVCRSGIVAAQELRQALRANGDARGEVPCPWVKADPERGRSLAPNGQIWE